MTTSTLERLPARSATLAPRRPLRAFLDDPRRPQLAILLALLAYGTLHLDFVLSPWAIPLTLIVAHLMETLIPRGPWHLCKVGCGFWGRSLAPGWSGWVSGVSTLLLFRSESAWPYVVVVVLALGSKRILRVRGRHFVNPTNGAVVVGSLVLPGWIASGQWGHGVLLPFIMASGGLLVLTRAARIDTALSFLLGTAAFLALRNLAFGHPWPTLAHAFTSGTLWLFALYMITDPKTTPQARPARVAHGLWVAGLAIALQQLFFVRDAFLWALFASAPLVPLLDHFTAPRPKGDDS